MKGKKAPSRYTSSEILGNAGKSPIEVLLPCLFIYLFIYLIYLLTLFNVKKKQLQVLIHIDKKKIIIIINNNWLCVFYLYESQPPMYVLHTRHEHFGSFHSLIFRLKLTRDLIFCLKLTRDLIFCLKLTRELLFFIFAGSCCHNCGPLYAIAPRP